MAQSLAGAIALIEAGRAREAVDPLIALTNACPDRREAFYVLGHALEALRRWPEAGQAWMNAARLASAARPPADVEQIISDIETGSGGGPAGIDLADVPESALGDDEVVTETWARILSRQNEFELAAAVYRKLASKNPDHAARYLESARRVQERSGDQGA